MAGRILEGGGVLTVNLNRHITLRVTRDEADRISLDTIRSDGSVSAYLRRLIQQDQESKQLGEVA